ncbi:related to pathway-specific regulatory protein nit-4 [Fusarium fujikuroi]|nr:pathway-specific regulatory protein nit-4 [Fusarium fujikuroi]SCN98039.1 related to pathway-specific regulatory protein nit-4 [Fusarium fujikuroi]SCN99490.1 related to pathway-specific regulatory protein nit-4 [Fusarium fujikuroi]SCO49140.1 related to pathway-specific regulatory protein nit-4 [Fusarium fujikuroi]SCV55539.1 related to pathway-specific regulatory protein nit-4 [Fusarium fujikuroi]
MSSQGNGVIMVADDGPSQRPPKSLAKACLACRTKKIRCDAVKPECGNCASQKRECIYRKETPRKRPTFSQIAKLQRDLAALKVFLLTLKRSSPEEREKLLDAAVDEDGAVNLLDSTEPGPPEEASSRKNTSQPIDRSATTPIVSSDDELNIANFISVDDAGTTNSFGPSSALHNPARNDRGTPSSRQSTTTTEHVKNELIANAALQRHLEHRLTRHATIAGEPTELALHLLNLHWARQHHTFLLTYRPVVMRDLECSGPYCSAFMLNAIFACCSKFSPRPDVRDDPDDASSVGRRFFKRCDELLSSEYLLIRPHISTIVGLVLLGSTYNARGETSKGWLYTGYALRMVYDLGLHLDPKQTTEDPEELEIRRRVFWGVFVCDKLQSLYMGRPVAINLRDSQVSREFLDLYEEMEPFYPSVLATGSSSRLDENMGDAIPRYSVSTFQQLCLLSKIMTTIINRFYVVGATFSNAQIDLQKIEQALHQWRHKLPSELDFQPWLSTSTAVQTPNIMVLQNVYYSLIILVHRPFISDDHLRSTATAGRSWEQCTVAARSITSIASVYKSTYGLNGAPYVLAYTVYVACTIHVRNAASQSQTRDHLTMLKSSLECLDELCTANPGVAKPANSIRRLIEANHLNLVTEEPHSCRQNDMSFDLDIIHSTFSVNELSNTGSDMFRMADFEYAKRRASAGFCKDSSGVLNYPEARSINNDQIPKPKVIYADSCGSKYGKWSLFNQVESWQMEVAVETVKTGTTLIENTVPTTRYGDLKTADLVEIEGFRSTAAVIHEYLHGKASRPLLIAVFGQPGTGKSFGVKEVIKTVLSSFGKGLKKDWKPIEANLSQFKDQSDLSGIFDDVRDMTISGDIPAVLFDEFDSALDKQALGWLKYLLAPMQDGKYLQSGSVRSLGRAIFVFIGGTSSTFEDFTGESINSKKDDESQSQTNDAQSLQKQKWAIKDKGAKKPDFVSRLSAHINVAGPNKSGNNKDDKMWVMRRAMLLRNMLERRLGTKDKADKSISVDETLLTALLKHEKIPHGSRSMELLLQMSRLSEGQKFDLSALPSDNQLGMHVDLEEFQKDLATACFEQDIRPIDTVLYNRHMWCTWEAKENVAKSKAQPMPSGETSSPQRKEQLDISVEESGVGQSVINLMA